MISRELLSQYLARYEVSNFLVTNLVNIRYLTGLQSTNAIALLTPERIHLYTDMRYERATHQIKDVTVHIGRDLMSLVSSDIKLNETLYVDEDFSFAGFKKINNVMPQVEIETKAKFIENLRLLKTKDELAVIEKACEITSKVWQQIQGEPFIGRSERFIAQRIHALVLELGGDGLAFDSIVAAGRNSASPHHTPSDYVIQAGDFIKCDFGAKIDGYHADMTRMAIAGTMENWQQEIFEVVTEAQTAGVASIKAGVSSKDIDAAARDIITKAGFATSFTHPSGHGIGLEIHEIPIHGSQDITLAPDMTITVEPGIYLEGKGGVRLEDTLVVLENGSRNLTMASKALVEVE